MHCRRVRNEGIEEAQKRNKTGKHETADFRVLTLKVISMTYRTLELRTERLDRQPAMY